MRRKPFYFSKGKKQRTMITLLYKGTWQREAMSPSKDNKHLFPIWLCVGLREGRRIVSFTGLPPLPRSTHQLFLFAGIQC